MSDPHLDAELIAEERKRFNAFVSIAWILAILTGIEIIIIFLPFANWLIYSTLVILSLIKFLFVILWFMHLIYDRQLLFWIFGSGLLLATGTATALLFLLTPADVDTDAWGAAMPAATERRAVVAV